MEAVSTYFKEAAIADERETKAYVEFLMNYNETPEGTTASMVSGTELAEISNVSDIIDGERIQPTVATFEKREVPQDGVDATALENAFALDGSFILPSRAETRGFWSSTRSLDTNFMPATRPLIELDFGSLIEFDEMSIVFGQEGHATSFTIQIDFATPIEFFNDQDIFTVDMKDYVENWQGGATTVTISIDRWSNKGQHAKIRRFDLGITKIYSDSEIVNLKVHERTDMLSVDIPSNEASLTVENLGDDFNILNRNGYYKYLSENPEMNISMGYMTENGEELVKMGQFFVETYSQQKNQLTLRGFDLVERLNDVKYHGWYLPAPVSNNAPDVITGLMTMIGVDKYRISTELNKADLSVVENAHRFWTDSRPLSGRELLSKISVYYGCNIWVDRDGYLNFGYFNDRSTYYFTARVNTGETIRVEDCVEYPTIDENEILKTISWTSVNRFAVDGTRQVLPVRTYSVSGGQRLVFPLNEFVSNAVSLTNQATSGASITGIDCDGFALYVTTSGTGTVTFGASDGNFTIDTYPDRDITDQNLIDLYDTEYSMDISYIQRNRGYLLSLTMFRIYDTDFEIAPLGMLTEQLRWLFEKSKKITYTADWRQNLAYQLGDIVNIENKYDVSTEMIITEQQFEYNGKLSGVTKGVGDLPE